MTIRGRPQLFLLCAFLMKYVSIFSVTSKSAMTPSFIGLMATIFPGGPRSISLAPVPTASTLPVTLLTATIEGSLTTMPRPLAYTQVLAVPRSMARSVERNERSEPRPILCRTMQPGLFSLGDANSVFARFLYLVHRHIGGSYQLFSGGSHVGQRGDPDRRRETELQSIAFEERMNAQSLSHAVSYCRGTFGASVGQHDCELIAPEAGDDVGFTRAASNDSRGFHERPGSRLVAL